jgi:asparagine synthase (glutamine-hydrolysing)
MCGIYGFYLRRETAHHERLEAAGRLLHHRGPDGSGLYQEGRLAIGHTRLAIIDLAGGHQPMWSDDGRYGVVFNGEIYNFQELQKAEQERGYKFQTRSDTEVILALYARLGPKCVEHFRGMFAFAIWDKFDKTLFLARDRLGVKPLFYAQTPDGFFFASELRALLALNPALGSQLDFDALAGYFARQYILDPATAYTQVKKLEPGTSFFISANGAVQRARYWRPESLPVENIDEREACERLKQLVFEATRLRLISDVPWGAFLSGGIDSSVTVAVMSKLLGQKVRTFSIGFGDPKFDEREHARRVAKHCGTEHHEYEVDLDKDLPAVLDKILFHFAEPFADTSILPSYYVAKMARQEVTVVLTGDGADETWGGYKRHYHLALLDRLSRYNAVAPWRHARKFTVALESIFGRKKQFPVSRFDKLLLDPALSPEILTQQLSAAERSKIFRAEPLIAANQRFQLNLDIAVNPAWDAFTRFLWYDVKTFLAGDVLPKVDIATMLNSLEARSPFLDHKVVEFAFSLPTSIKRPRLKSGKHLIKKTFADLLPDGHFDRPKMGFSPPLAKWLRTTLRQWCGDQLHTAACREYLDSDHLDLLFHEHQNGSDHSKVLWLSAVFSHWAASK